MKKNGNESFYTKEELLEKANKRLRKMEFYCDTIEKQLDSVINDESPDNRKLKNHLLTIYNQQANAVINATKNLINIDKVQLVNTIDEEDKPAKGLVD